MKKVLLSIASLGIAILLQAQVSLTINETTAGTLSTLLTQNQKDSLTNLTITGSINNNDFITISNNMAKLAILDLSGATIVASQYNTANNLPEDAFVFMGVPVWSGNPTLKAVTLPINLTSIGNEAFYGS